ncbi:MAG TPA: thioredoxin domain-containing protein [Anaerolineales bacterium]
MPKKQYRDTETASKRQQLREQRSRRQRQQRIVFFLGLAGVVLVVAALIIIPQIQAARAPVGKIVQITPNPRPQASGTAAGDPKAKVVIDVYEDFQCPACRQYTETTEQQLMKNEIASGKVYYVFRHFPIIDRATWSSPSKESHQAANASMCAADQGRFWDYHDILFANWTGENVGDFTDKRLAAFAQTLNLDMNKFNTCFNNNTFRDKIDADYNQGGKLGVKGTPSVFVNGQEVSPGYIPDYSQMQAAINAALAK